MKIILASNSPRRKEILSSFGFEVVTVPSAPENPPPENLTVEEKVSFLALEKGLDAEKLYPDTPVVSADTVVVLGESIMGKPKDRQNAFEMLRALSGKTHKVITAYTLFYKGQRVSRSVVTDVTFYELTDEEILDYVDTGEVYDKAGSYGIQGKGAVLVKGIQGDYLNVVGFPLSDFYRSYLWAVK
ncbi:MAG: septum formation protein Maf [Ruminococcaceae bacterium]|nr:septum formation protein Maf [Oscillospiraceae bacterium]